MFMRSLLLPLLLALFCFPDSGFAEPVYTNPVSGNTYYKTKEDACTAVIPQLQDFFAASNDRGLTILFTLNSVSSAGGICYYNYVRNDGNTGLSASNAGGPNSAAVVDHECVVDESLKINWPLGPRDTTFTNNVNPALATLPPWPVCTNGCKASYVSVDSCFTFDDQTPLFLYCDYNAKKTGESCSTADTAPKPDTSQCPSGTVLSGSSCVTETPPDPCIAEPTGAGCPGGNTGGDTGGNTGGDTGGNTGGDTGGNTGGDTGGNTGGASGLGCNEAFVCTGDSVQCVQANLEKQQLCDDKTGHDYPIAGKGVLDLYTEQHEDNEVEETEVHLTSILTGPGTARFLPASCPPAQTFTVYGRQFAFSNDYFCNFATSMSWLVVAMASLFAAVYIGNSFKG